VERGEVSASKLVEIAAGIGLGVDCGAVKGRSWSVVSLGRGGSGNLGGEECCCREGGGCDEGDRVARMEVIHV
jgi:hypothetical protein